MAETVSPETEAIVNELQSRRGQLNPQQQTIMDELGRRIGMKGAVTAPETATAVQERPARGWGESALRTGTIFSQGFNEGLANVLGLPVDMVTGAINMVLKPTGAKIETPILGSQFLREHALPKPVFKPETAGDRIVSRIGQEVGATAPLIPLTLWAVGAVEAPGALRAMGEVARAPSTFARLAKMPRAVLEELAKVPPAVLARAEVAIAGAAGFGAGFMKELASRLGAGTLGQHYAEFFGQVIGSFGPTTALDAIRWTTRTIGAKIPPVRPQAVEQEVGQQLQRVLEPSPTAETNLEQARALQEEVPGFKPTLGQATGEPSVIAKERAIQAGSPAAQGRFAEQQAEATGAIRRELGRAGEEAIGGPGTAETVRTHLEDLQREAQRQISTGETTVANLETTSMSDFERHVNRQVAAVQQKADEAATQAEGTIHGLQPISTDPQVRGRVIRSELTARNEAFSREAGRRYNAIDPENIIRLDSSLIRSSIQRVKDEIGRFGQEVPMLANIESSLAAGESIKELHRLRQAVWNAGVADPYTKAMLRPVREAIEQTLDAFGNQGQLIVNGPVAAPAEYVQQAITQFRETNRWYAGELKKYRMGAAEEILARGNRGEYDIPDSAVVEAYFNKRTGAVEAAQQFKMALGGDVEAAAALRDHARQSFLESAVDVNGKVNAKRMQVWMKQHQAALAEFPAIRQEFANAVKAQQTADTTQAELKAVTTSVETQRQDILQARGTVPESLTGRAAEQYFLAQRTQAEVERGAAKLYLNTEPDLAMGRVLKSANPRQQMQDLVNLVQGDQAAIRGLRRAFTDTMEAAIESKQIARATGERMLNPVAMRDFLTKNRAVMEVLYDKAYLAKLDRIQEAAEMVSKTATPLRPGTDTAEKLQGTTGMLSTPQILSRLYAIETGRLGHHFVIGEWITRFARYVTRELSTRQVNALMEEALINPEVADTLIRTMKGAEPNLLIRRLHGHLVNMGLADQGRQQ